MKLQVAFDILPLNRMKDIIKGAKDYIDIIEFGTPLVLKYGTTLIDEIKEWCGGGVLLADTKIVDAGYEEA